MKRMAAPVPEWWISEVSGEPVHIDELIECEPCGGTGEVDRQGEWSNGVVFDYEDTCPECGGPGLLEGYGVNGSNYAPRRVRPFDDTRPAA